MHRCQVDEHLLSAHAYSTADKYGGSTTLLRCASAVIGDHHHHHHHQKSPALDDRHVVQLEDLCPYHQHVRLVAGRPTSSPSERRRTPGEHGDDCRTSAELELRDRPPDDVAGRPTAYDRPTGTYDVSGGLGAGSTAAARNVRSSGTCRRSFVTFKPTPTASNAVRGGGGGGGDVPVRTAPTSCVSLDLIRTLRASSTSQVVDAVEMSSQEDASSDSPDSVSIGVGCVTVAQPSSETCGAV